MTRDSDRDAEFTDFASAHWRRLVRSATLLGCSSHEAEDLAQATLVRCYVKWGKVRAADNPDAYVARMLLNVHRQSRRRRWWGERPTAELPEAAVVDETFGIDDADAVHRALGRLGSGQLEVVVLRIFLGLSEREAADALGIPSGTAKSRLSRALTRLAADDDVRALFDGTTP